MTYTEAFDNQVVYSVFKGGHIHKKHILDGHCRKCQIPGSLLTKFLIIKLETVRGQESHLGHVVNETVDRFDHLQRICGSKSLSRQQNTHVLLGIVAEALPAGKILRVEEPNEEDEPFVPDVSPVSDSSDEGLAEATLVIDRQKKQLFESNILQGIIALAAAVGDIAAIEGSLVQGSELDSGSEHFTTAIHAASRRGQVEAVKMLLEKGSEAHPLHTIRSTPLGAACFGGHEQVVRLLLNARGKPLPFSESQLDAAIRLALKGGNPELVDVFLEECKAIEDRTDHRFVIISEEEILLIAANCGSEEIVNKMLDEDVDIDGVGTREGRIAYMKSPLELAAAAGRLNIVKLLLKRGSSKEIDRYHNAFVLAVRERRDDVARYLLQDGANINHVAPRPNHWRRRGSALMTSCSHADKEMVEYLLSNGVDLSAVVEGSKENQGSCALTSACRRGHTEIARLLINAGVDPNKEQWTRGKGGRSNLYYARKSEQPGIVKALLELGARE